MPHACKIFIDLLCWSRHVLINLSVFSISSISIVLYIFCIWSWIHSCLLCLRVISFSVSLVDIYTTILTIPLVWISKARVTERRKEDDGINGLWLCILEWYKCHACMHMRSLTLMLQLSFMHSSTHCRHIVQGSVSTTITFYAFLSASLFNSFLPTQETYVLEYDVTVLSSIE
jgi:hypothetical protein